MPQRMANPAKRQLVHAPDRGKLPEDFMRRRARCQDLHPGSGERGLDFLNERRHEERIAKARVRTTDENGRASMPLRRGYRGARGGSHGRIMAWPGHCVAL